MITYYDTPNSLSEERVYEECLKIYTSTNGDEDAVIGYLSELASSVHSCPDRCDMWACLEYERLTQPLYEEKDIEEQYVILYPCSSQADDTEIKVYNDLWI